MSIPGLLGTALYTALSQYSAGTALYGTRIYEGQAPLGGSLPYVIYTFVGGGEIYETPTRMLDVNVDVTCIAATQIQAQSGAAHIEGALREKQLTATGWTTLRVNEGAVISTFANVQGKQYYQCGAEYRIRLSNQ